MTHKKQSRYQGFEQGPIRPPSEAASLLIRLTRNCPWNRCSFCPVYKGTSFSVRPPEHIIKDIDQVKHQVDRIQAYHPDQTINQDISIKHFFDSLSALPFINQNGCESILDVGSGGGFPGVPLSIVLPDTRVTLLDSARKRVHFLKYVSQILGLQNTHVCHERLETFNPEKRYDIIISRAFSEISYFVNLSKVFLNDFGRIIAMKGQHVYNELQMFDASSFHVTIESYTLPVINQKRYLVILALQ